MRPGNAASPTSYVSSIAFEQKEHRKLSRLRTHSLRSLFEHLPLLHEGVADSVGLAAELDEPPVVDDAVDRGGDHLVVPER